MKDHFSGGRPKAHVRYLESRLIRLTQDAGTIPLTNLTHPDFQRLPEADRADMEAFIEQVKIILPITGFDLFRRRASSANAIGTQTTAGAEGATFVFSTGGARATARETEEGFVVLAGSTARKTPSGSFPAGYQALRDKLMASGQLVDGSTIDLLQFAGDVVFSSPSAAASIVSARSASGPIEWKVTGTGQLQSLA